MNDPRNISDILLAASSGRLNVTQFRGATLTQGGAQTGAPSRRVPDEVLASLVEGDDPALTADRGDWPAAWQLTPTGRRALGDRTR